MRLYINVDHVATVRQARRTDEPDPVRAAVMAELGGADGITVHLREDRRHIQDEDIDRLAGTIRTVLNFELAVDGSVLAIAERMRPKQVTLVPENREEVTTEGGLSLAPDRLEPLRAAVDRLRTVGSRVSLFIDPDLVAIEASAALGADAVELHTGEYSLARRDEDRARELTRLLEAARAGVAAGLAVHAGHGLTYENVIPVAAIPEIEELNIGHSVVSRAVLVGMERAVREMGVLVRTARDRVPQPGRWLSPIGY